ncbi:TonB-dependent receptor [Flavobacterium acetivorans]|uniref:TonB-dependent receptor n=1 Tax=Flavobacterium acetivorans TaxID=2893883 RepID=UPI001E4DA73F|nr:TonB-dependent receptor [Flavobacterium sp. F-29]UFH35503.1 TonB-dependent receptor [Flavobacterium sp. F-29]
MSKNFSNKTIFKIMKFSFIQLVLLTITINMCYSNTSYGQGPLAERVSLSIKNGSIKNLLQLIETQANVTFSYQAQVISSKAKINAEFKNETLQEVLNKVLSSQDIKFQVLRNNQIVLNKSNNLENTTATGAIDDQQTVTGKVVDEQGISLPGVNVYKKGTKTGVSTDLDGNFTIEANKGDVLVFTYLGFVNQEMQIKDNKILKIVLKSEAQQMNEVVVVGYGTQKKSKVTGSVVSVKGEELTRAPAPNMTSALAGRLPGLVVNQSSGRPGSDAASISVRGFNSKGEQPLLIVDGVQRNFNQLDPNEIESITVLKDASAAVYGVLGGSGVILVTTKRGVVGKPVITYNATSSITEATRYPDMATFKQYESIASSHRRGNEWHIFDSYITPERLEALNNGSDLGTNWIKEVSSSFALQQQQNLNVRGGSENMKYFLSGGYLNQGSQWKSGDFGFERMNFTANFDANISNNLSLSVGLGLRREVRDSSPADGDGDIGDLVFGHPAFPASIPNGGLVVVNSSNATSPVASTTKSIGGYNLGINNVQNGDFSLKYKIPNVEGLSVEGKVAFIQNFDFGKRLEKPFSLWAWDGANYIGNQISNGGIVDLTESSYRFDRLTTNLRINYDRQFGEHSFSALGLFEKIKEQSTSVTAIGNDVISSETPYLNFSNPENRNALGFANELGRTGLVGRLNYNYSGKYLLELSFRIDKSSLFPKETRTGFFPGVSAGWLISRENFMRDTNFVRNLKLRSSYSKLGNDGANTYDYIEGFQVLNVNGGYVFNNKFQTGIATLGVPNPSITWQNTELYNVGIDAGFLNNSLTLEVDAFYRLRSGILTRDTQGITIPETAGAELPLENLESRDNRGFEAALTYRDNQGDFKYSISANGSWAREKYKTTIETLVQEDADLERIQRLSGNWVNRTFGYQFDGFWNQKELDVLIENKTNNSDAYIDYGENPLNIRPGDIRVKDYNGDGVIDLRDQVLIGKGNVPEILFGFNTQLEYKNWDFTMFWQGAANFYQSMSTTERGLLLHASGPRTPYSYLYGRVWSEENEANAQFPADLDGRYNNATLDKYFINSKYVRLKNLVIAYSLPSETLKTAGIDKLRIYLSGTNLFTLDNLGIFPVDPEVGGVGSYPIQKVYTLGINLSL